MGVRVTAAVEATVRPPSAPASVEVVPARAELAGSGTAGAIVSITMFLLPTLGMPTAEIYQDTFKSIVVALGTMGALLALAWKQHAPGAARTHSLLLLPLLLALYAVASMSWGHSYLAGGEAIRWAMFAALLAVGMNTLTGERLAWLAWGVHAGAVAAAGWAILQFLFDWSFFAQGVHPAATFANRNFMAEYLVCALPFSGMLLARARREAAVAALSASIGLIAVAIMMTGTRSALITMWIQAGLVFPIVAWRYRTALPARYWSGRTRFIAAGALLATVAGLGALPCADQQLLDEGRGDTALQRAFLRTRAIRLDDRSLGVRRIMWRATARMIAAHPLTGVGAGSWEVQVPKYQEPSQPVETDYYAHNEFLQLLAEYGLVGIVFLVQLGRYLARATVETWSKPAETAAAGWRLTALCSLLALLTVSNLGFPWHMPATGAIFALCLGVLAGSDSQAGPRRSGARFFRWPAAWRSPALLIAACATAAALYASRQAAQAELKLVRALQIALYISDYPDSNNPLLQPLKQETLRLAREGIAINPHLRKITPGIADEMARWGDFKDAVPIWESILASRPYIVGINTNVARGYLALHEPAQAQRYFARARSVSPDSPGVRSLDVALLMQTGDVHTALTRAQAALQQGRYDEDLLINAFVLATRADEPRFAQQAMVKLADEFPSGRTSAYVQLAAAYASTGKDDAQAVRAYRQAIALSTPEQRSALLATIPQRLQPQVR